MLVFLIVCLACAAGETVLWLIWIQKRKKRKLQIIKSLTWLVRDRVLQTTLQNHITSEQAVMREYRSPFLWLEFLDTRPWLAGVFALDEAITVGRSQENKITIRGDGVSRLHCKIALIDGALYLFDLGSANGTRIRRGLLQRITLNGQTAETLLDKDMVVIGDYRMRIHVIYGCEAAK